MDPVFWDPFCEGLNASCPQREVMPERMPEFDFLVISHQHLDHFDIRTLASLPKDVDVLVPPDRLMVETLKELGYSSIYPLQEFDKVRCGDTVLMTTRSEVRVPEFGLVVSDPAGVFWNTVDTYFAPPTIQKVRESYPTIDFLLATWHISMETAYQNHRPLAFPYELYSRLFALLRLVEPQAIAPGASGWKYIDHAAWQNQVVFPVTRERFCHDLQQSFPAIADRVFAFNPGDTIQFDRGRYDHAEASCDYARMVTDDRQCLDFSPVTVGNPLVDRNPAAVDETVLHNAITAAVETEFAAFLQAHQSTLFHLHQHWQVILQLNVVFPESCGQWYLDFSQTPLTLISGRHPLANLFSYITASGFYSMLENHRGWDYLWCSGEYRTFHKIYQMTNHGILIPNSEESIAEPLQVFLNSRQIPGANLRAEVRSHQDKNPLPSAHQSPSSCTENPMICLGKVYIKRRKK